MEAVNILIKHPEIRKMDIIQADHGQAPGPDLETGDYNYFDPFELIDYAEIYAPFDNKKLQRKIRRLKKKTEDNYIELSVNKGKDGRIENGSYLVLPIIPARSPNLLPSKAWST